MRFLSFLPWTFLVACSQLGAEGEPGAPGAPGEVGPAGAAGPAGPTGGVRWVDATGTQVEGVFGADPVAPGLNYFDPDGHIWKIDPETLEVDVSAIGRKVHASANCSGSVFYEIGLPRVATQVINQVTVEFRVRLDATTAQNISPRSFLNSGNCVSDPGTSRALAETDTVVVSKPVVAGTGPLHAEL